MNPEAFATRGLRRHVWPRSAAVAGLCACAEGKQQEGQDGGGQGGGSGRPMAAKGRPEGGAAGCTDRSASKGEAAVWGGMSESWCVAGGGGPRGYRGVRVGAGDWRWSSRVQKSGRRVSLDPGAPGLRPPLPLAVFGEAGGTGRPLTCPRPRSSLPHHQGHAPGAVPQDPGRAGRRRQEV